MFPKARHIIQFDSVRCRMDEADRDRAEKWDEENVEGEGARWKRIKSGRRGDVDGWWQGEMEHGALRKERREGGGSSEAESSRRCNGSHSSLCQPSKCSTGGDPKLCHPSESSQHTHAFTSMSIHAHTEEIHVYDP